MVVLKATFIMHHWNKKLYQNFFLDPWVIWIVPEDFHGMEKFLDGVKPVELFFVSSAWGIVGVQTVLKW